MSRRESWSNLVRFSLFDGISHGISTRHGGVSPSPYATFNMGYTTGDAEANVRESRRRFAQRLAVNSDQIVVGHLSHGREVAVFRRSNTESVDHERMSGGSRLAAGDRSFPADGVISDQQGTHFLLTFADCVPLVFADRRRGVIGAAHAGWRGTATGIAEEVIRAMQREFGSSPGDIVAGVGPSIGPCCYQVGQNVLDLFHRSGTPPIVRREDGQIWLNLWQSNREQMVRSGVPDSAIEISGICTSCHVDHFFSHRAENGRTGRHALLIGMR